MSDLSARATHLLELCRKHGVKLAFAESCTGGLVSSLVTEISGSSDVFMGGAVTYANEAKHNVIGVTVESLEKYGAVSAQVAEEMAAGACRTFGVEAAASITGIAGPSGGTPEKPVGTVYIGCSVKGKVSVAHHLFSGDRRSVREQSAAAALDMLIDVLIEAQPAQ